MHYRKEDGKKQLAIRKCKNVINRNFVIKTEENTNRIRNKSDHRKKIGEKEKRPVALSQI